MLDLPGVVRLSVIRAEDDKLLIGGEPMATTTFIAVLSADVARTGAGLAVGSTDRELRRAQGDPLAATPRVVDPRLQSFAASPGATYFVQDGRVFAVIVEPRRPPTTPAAVDATAPAAVVCPTLPALGAEALARLQLPASAPVFVACLGDDPEYVAVSGEELIVIHRDGDRRLGTTALPGLRFAGALTSDGKDELVAIRHELDADRRRWLASVWRHEGGRLVKVGEDAVFEISASNADWIGARLVELDLALHVEASADTLRIGGYLIDRLPQRVRNIVPLTPVTIARRRRGPAVLDGAVGSGSGSGSSGAGSGSGSATAGAGSANSGSGSASSGATSGSGSQTPHIDAPR